MTKSDFLKEHASDGIKTASKLTWAVAILCLLTMLISIYQSHTNDIRKIPAFMLTLRGEVENLDEELDTSLSKDMTLKSHEHTAAERLKEEFSFANFMTYAEINKSKSIDELADIAMTFLKIVAIVAIVGAAVTLLAAYYKNHLALIASLLLSIAAATVSSFTVLIVTLLLHISLFVTFYIINRAYQQYKNA